jgi:hypothetical protein
MATAQPRRQPRSRTLEDPPRRRADTQQLAERLRTIRRDRERLSRQLADELEAVVAPLVTVARDPHNDSGGTTPSGDAAVTTDLL